MKQKFPSIGFAILLGTTFATISCSNDAALPEQDNRIPHGYEQIVSTAKFSCYKPTGETRAAGTTDEIIKVQDLPGYTIIFSENPNKNVEGYMNLSKFIKDGIVVGEVYTNVEETEEGWIVKYKTEGDENVSFLPKQTTRAKSSNMGDRVIDCVTDAYSNHGWASVWITIQSAFIPETAVAIAADCAIRNF